jgi:ABC-type sugar transport system substrate-binding protein
MSTTHTYLAVFLGSKTGPQREAWDALTQAERDACQQRGAAAWGAWVGQHQEAILELGGPLGKTKRIGPDGITDVTNGMAAFTLVRAESHEAAAKLFENHPHFTIFPGDAVEIMPVLPPPRG